MLKKKIFTVICFLLISSSTCFAANYTYCPETFVSGEQYVGWLTVIDPKVDKPLPFFGAAEVSGMIGCKYKQGDMLFGAQLISLFSANIQENGQVLPYWYPDGQGYVCDSTGGDITHCPFVV